MSENLGLGKIIEAEQARDAIHIAVAPVTAGEKLQPGEHIGLGADGKATSNGVKLIGAVDPFLTKPVFPGQRFWLFLYPGSITSLRHEWMHPAFGGPQPPDTDPLAMVKARLADFASNFELSYDGLMRAAEHWLEDGDYYICRGFDTPSIAYSDDAVEQFWRDYETVTGKRVTDRRESFFSCSC